MTSGMVSVDHHRELIDTKDARIAELHEQVAKWTRLALDNERDVSVTLAMVQEFVAWHLERGEHESVRAAVQAALKDTGISGGEMCEIVERLGICGVDYVSREYEVTLTIPVTITLSVEACDEDAAEEAARDEAECNGLDNYYMDIDWYRVDIYEVREV
jgi:hypothetical protein